MGLAAPFYMRCWRIVPNLVELLGAFDPVAARQDSAPFYDRCSKAAISAFLTLARRYPFTGRKPSLSRPDRTRWSSLSVPVSLNCPNSFGPISCDANEDADLDATERLLKTLQSVGLLLLQDRGFPSAATLVIGEPASGSWWAHPRSHEIFRCVSAISGHPDVLVTKLLDGKVTFVHRWLWPAVLAVATGRDKWQEAGLSQDARALLDQVEEKGSVTAFGKAVKEIECRLLAHGNQMHTDLGRHMTVLETWARWSERAGCSMVLSAEQGRAQLEAAVQQAGGRVSMLPWHKLAPKQRSRRGQSSR